MENNKTWLLIADASKARLYSLYKAKILQPKNSDGLRLIGEFAHEQSRKKISELVTDKMGEFGGGSFAAPTSPKEHEAEQFAHILLNQLETGRKAKSFRDLILVAPPNFMGLLHKHMPHEISKLINQTIEKDYTRYNEKELMHHLLQCL